MPKGIYPHLNRTSKEEIEKFINWYKEHKETYDRIKTPHRLAVRDYEIETKIKINPQTAFKYISKL